MASLNQITTLISRKKMLEARAGVAPLSPVKGFAFGVGGVDANGDVIAPLETDAELKQEIYRKDIDGFEFLSDTKCRYRCTLEEDELVAEKITELGLYDTDGDIINIKTFFVKMKDGDMTMTFDIDDVF